MAVFIRSFRFEMLELCKWRIEQMAVEAIVFESFLLLTSNSIAAYIRVSSANSELSSVLGELLRILLHSDRDLWIGYALSHAFRD